MPLSGQLDTLHYTLKNQIGNGFFYMMFEYANKPGVMREGIYKFNVRNIKRINYEVKNYFKSEFPYFYVLKSGFKSHIFKDNIKVYIPENNGNGCWVTPTPCVGGVNPKTQGAKKVYSYNVFFSKK